MLVLAELELVELRTKAGVLRRQAWFLTQAGRDLLAIVGTGEP
ncbi:hypothetical protein [Methylobacterium sp. J-030]|nr:hypothetical protein [Methylobacterium sp. J-030]